MLSVESSVRGKSEAPAGWTSDAACKVRALVDGQAAGFLGRATLQRLFHAFSYAVEQKSLGDGDE